MASPSCKKVLILYPLCHLKVRAKKSYLHFCQEIVFLKNAVRISDIFLQFSFFMSVWGKKYRPISAKICLFSPFRGYCPDGEDLVKVLGPFSLLSWKKTMNVAFTSKMAFVFSIDKVWNNEVKTIVLWLIVCELEFECLCKNIEREKDHYYNIKNSPLNNYRVP